MPIPVPEHLGALHPFEQVLVVLLAFGPFLLLWVCVRIARRHAAQEDGHGTEGPDGHDRSASHS